MKIMVTGAAGFIRSLYADYLVYVGEDIISVDSLTYAGKLA